MFFDAHIDVGESWDRRIERELTGAGAVVVLWSRLSTESDWVRLEARSGKSRGVLCPALIEDVAVPLEFSSIQCADLRSWQGEPDHGELTRLLNRSHVCAAANSPRQPLPTDAAPFHHAFPKPRLTALMKTASQDLLASVPGDLEPSAAFVTILTATVLSGGSESYQAEAEEWRAAVHRSKFLRNLAAAELNLLLSNVRTRLEDDYVFCLANAAKSLPADMAEPLFANCALLLVADGGGPHEEAAFASMLAGLLSLEVEVGRRILRDAAKMSRY